MLITHHSLAQFRQNISKFLQKRKFNNVCNSNYLIPKFQQQANGGTIHITHQSVHSRQTLANFFKNHLNVCEIIIICIRNPNNKKYRKYNKQIQYPSLNNQLIGC